MNYSAILDLKNVNIVKEKDIKNQKCSVLLLDQNRLLDDIDLITFLKTNVIITNEIDLQRVYDTLLDYDKDWVLLKSIVVISMEDFDRVNSELISLENVCVENTTEKSIEDEFVLEFSKSTGVSKKFVQNSIVKRTK